MAMGTRLQQIRIDDVTQTGPIFSRSYHDGTTPLVLVPGPRSSCSCALRIPSDAHVVFQKWGRDVDPYAPGFHCLPSWYRIAYLVSRQTCTYNAPVRNVPTKDNVKVRVDLTLVFSISKPRDFVYLLGAARFDELLRAAAEEAIRAMVRRTTVDGVYELRGVAADDLLQDLNDKFREFGVRFSTCTITSVEMPHELAHSLESATTYESKIQEEVKRQEFKMSQLLNRAAKEKREVEIRNEKMMKELQACKHRAQIELEKAEIDGERRKQVAVMKAQEEARVKQIDAEASLRNSKTSSERETMLAQQQCESKCSASRIEADQEARSIAIRSEAALEKAKNKSRARFAEAEAEATAGEMLTAKREHEMEVGKLEVMQKLACKGRMMVVGESGERLIRAILQTADVEAFGEEGEATE